MIVYKDQGWCRTSVIEGCKNEKCIRNYTKAEEERNKNGVDLPLNIVNLKTGECGYEPV